MRTDLERDLENKLIEDLQHVVTHYFEMCEIADVSNRHQFGTIMYVFSSLLIQVAQGVHLDRDQFMGALRTHWDRNKAKGEA